MKLKKTQMDNKQMFMCLMVKEHRGMDTLTRRVLSKSVSPLLFTYTRGRQRPPYSRICRNTSAINSPLSMQGTSVNRILWEGSEKSVLQRV